MSVCLSCPKMRRRNDVRACSKSVLGGSSLRNEKLQENRVSETRKAADKTRTYENRKPQR